MPNKAIPDLTAVTPPVDRASLIELSIPGGGSRKATLTQAYAPVVQDITTGASPIDITEPFADVYVITTGGTKGVEEINLPAFADYAEENIGKEITFSLGTRTTPVDIVHVIYNAGQVTLAQAGSPQIMFVCDGQAWSATEYYSAVISNRPQGFRSHVEGNSTLASGEASHAEGSGTTASGLASHAEGGSTVASGENSHAENNQSIASGDNSHCEGNLSEASGGGSHAEGNQNLASGQCSHSEGQNTTASAARSHAEGYYTVASGQSSHAEGDNTVASGEASHASGQQSHARLDRSQAYAVSCFDVPGDAQHVRLSFRNETQDDTETVLISDGNEPTALNQMSLLDNSAMGFYGTVEAREAATGDVSYWKYEGLITRGVGEATTALVAPVTPSLVAQAAGAVLWSIAIIADTTNGAISIKVTGETGKTIRWLAEIHASELVQAP